MWELRGLHRKIRKLIKVSACFLPPDWQPLARMALYSLPFAWWSWFEILNPIYFLQQSNIYQNHKTATWINTWILCFLFFRPIITWWSDCSNPTPIVILFLSYVIIDILSVNIWTQNIKKWFFFVFFYFYKKKKKKHNN